MQQSVYTRPQIVNKQVFEQVWQYNIVTKTNSKLVNYETEQQ